VSRPKQDVLVHLDEESGELVFYTVASSQTVKLREESFGGIRPTIEELQEMPLDEAHRKIGGTVIGLLSLSSSVASKLALPQREEK
jgi:hypothetical protein